MNIRRYRPSDQGAVIALFREFMWELAPPGLGGELQAYIERAISDELGRIEEYYFERSDQGFWVADAGPVVGMAGVERHDRDSAELRRMAVARPYRKKGIARALLDTAEAFCRQHGYRKVVLSTSELQQAAAQLYQSSGYSTVRESAAQGLTHYHYEKALA